MIGNALPVVGAGGASPPVLWRTNQHLAVKPIDFWGSENVNDFDLDGSNGIIQWDNLGTSANHAAQGTAANRPIRDPASASLNGKPGVVVNGANSKALTLVSAWPFVGIQWGASVNNLTFESTSGVGNTMNTWDNLQRPSLMEIAWVQGNGTGTLDYWENGVHQETRVNQTMNIASGFLAIVLNAVNNGGGGAGRIMSANRLFNRASDGLRAANAVFGRICRLNYVPTLAERLRIEGDEFHNGDWGFALPAGHLYENDPPYV